MSKKRIRQRAQIGEETVWLTGKTNQDIFNAYLKQAIAAGIVAHAGQAARHAETKSSVPTVREFIEKTYYPTFIANLAPQDSGQLYAVHQPEHHPLLGG